MEIIIGLAQFIGLAVLAILAFFILVNIIRHIIIGSALTSANIMAQEKYPTIKIIDPKLRKKKLWKARLWLEIMLSPKQVNTLSNGTGMIVGEQYKIDCTKFIPRVSIS